MGVSLKTRHTFDDIDKKTRNYTALAWFSHHGGGNHGAPKEYKHEACSETATHWQAKHILCEHVGAYSFETSKCSGCTKHTNIEDGAGAVGRVEYTEKTSEGKTYRFDAVLMRNNAVSSVLEVWATHETSEQKREYCLQQGYTFAEFHAAHVVEAHKKAAPGEVFMLENLKTHVSECQECTQARRELELRIEQERLRKIESEKLRAIEAAEKGRLDMLEVAKQQKLYEQELETKLQAVRLEERRKAAELEKNAVDAKGHALIALLFEEGMVCTKAGKARLDAEEALRCSEKRKNRNLWYEAYRMQDAGQKVGEMGDLFGEYEHMRYELGDGYDHWVFDRLDDIKKREARDQLSHDRWVNARKRLF